MSGNLSFDGYMKEKTHYLPVRVYYADTDFSGVVHHTRYVEFMERGRSEFFRAFGLADHDGKELNSEIGSKTEPVFFALSNLNLKFKAPARIDNVLTVETRIEKLTGARFFMKQHIWREQTLMAEGEGCLVLINANNRPQRIPEYWRSLLC